MNSASPLPHVCISYKLQVGSLIYFVNPCHIITAIQIYILCSPVSRRSLTIYYFSVNLMFGPLTAFLLPVLNTRVIRGEQAVYWVQACFSLKHLTLHPPLTPAPARAHPLCFPRLPRRLQVSPLPTQAPNILVRRRPVLRVVGRTISLATLTRVLGLYLATERMGST